MLCERCKKNEATVHIKEFHGGVCNTHHLCAECAAAKEQQMNLGSLGFNIAEILFNLGKMATSSIKKNSPAEEVADPSVSCPECGWDAAKIRKNHGLLGCPECYKSFAGILSEAMMQVHKGSVHMGKHPLNRTGNDAAVLKAELKNLQKELAALVSREDYENAAVCRDRINAIKQNLEQMGQ